LTLLAGSMTIQPANKLGVGILVVKGKGSSLDTAPLTILDIGTLPRKWQLTGIDCSTVAQASD